MSSAALFPFAIPFGFYPQKEDKSENPFNRYIERNLKHLRYLSRTGNRSLEQFLQKIETHTEKLQQSQTTEITEAVKQLRFKARKHGIDDVYVAHAFALVREVADRTLHMRHYRHQLIGGWAMMQGMIAEMDTGQGKSLCATLTASTAALAGVPTHVITVNEYLASRDAATMAPLYNALGLTVACVLESMTEKEKQQAYSHDIVYCTNKQVAFDYLRDRMVMNRHSCERNLQLEALYSSSPGVDKLILRGLCFAIIDEADSVLIDEAVTPLVISASRESKDKRKVYERALAFAKQLTINDDYKLIAQEGRVQLTTRGSERLDVMGKAVGGLWSGPVPREELVTQALKVIHFFVCHKHYLVHEGKVQIIDEFTGRVMADRSWESGLHQMVEIKEGCALTEKRETLARISYQRFFRRYLNLSGMTGTAAEVKKELKSVYGLNVFRVLPAQISQKKFLPIEFCATEDAKWLSVVERIKALHAVGRPVLVGTRTLKASLQVSHLLKQYGLPHQLLNAQQHENEAHIITQAGEMGCITVATNMAGRGTDIKLPEEVKHLGGLYVIATERHESRRIDRQLYGRCGRQGDPGTVDIILSFEDDLIDRHAPKIIRRLILLIAKFGNDRLVDILFTGCQKIVERRQQAARSQVLKLDEHYANLLAFSGRME